ncbi:hypothetical protein BH11PSE10_BH11PSE10_06480 [soil metagenome]
MKTKNPISRSRRRLLSVALGTWLPSLPVVARPGTDAALRRSLQALVDDPQAPLASLSVLVQRQGQTVFEVQFGRRYIAPAGGLDLPVNRDTLFRIASVSKIIVALGVMRLVDAGRLDLAADVGALLGYALRNPHHPQRAISVQMLLTHQSSLTDAGPSVEPLESLRDALTTTAQRWALTAPGEYFEYCNLAYGVLASVIERASGQRFDQFMAAEVLGPLGMQGGFDAAALPPAQLANVATLYRKFDGKTWHANGPWVAQADDFHTAPPAQLAGLDGYELGRNGTIFGPQGRLRTRVQDLGRLMAMLAAGGMHEGRRHLSREAVKALLTERWRFDEQRRNGDSLDGEFQAWGLGLQHFIDRSRPGWGDRLVPGGGQQAWGHPGFAYGLQSALMFDPARRCGIVYAIGGTGADPEVSRGRYSSYAAWEERLQGLLWAVARA